MDVALLKPDLLLNMTRASGLRTWNLRGRALLPVVQGGMGVGVSAGRLAGTVAALGAMGTLSSVDLRRLHPDLMAQTGHLDKEPDAGDTINAANLVALDREIKKALALADGQGVVAVNVMKAISGYTDHVRKSLESGAQALVVGAGLPLDLPELATGFPNVALIPILSDARGVQLVVKKWEKKGRLPDAIILATARRHGLILATRKSKDFPMTLGDVIHPYGI